MRLLWDFDGTIMDTYPAYTDILYNILNGEHPKELIYQQLKISQTHAIHYFGLTTEQTEDMKMKSRALQPTDYRIFDDIEAILQRAEINVIMTHMERASVERILKDSQIAHYFTEIVAGDDGYRRKPDPESYQYLHDKYTIDYAIGDRELDLIPAKKIGIKTIMFQGSSEFADFEIDDYSKFEHFVL